MARAFGGLVMTGSKDKDYSMAVKFLDDTMPHQLRKGGYYLGQKTCAAMIEMLSEVPGTQSTWGQMVKPDSKLSLEKMTTASTDKLRNVELQSGTVSSKQVTPSLRLCAPSLCQYDTMSDAGLESEHDDGGLGPLQRLLADIYEFEVVIEDRQFQCHSYPFALKSSFFKNSFSKAGSEKKSFPRQERPKHQITLDLPGGSQTFQLIRNFCYDSRVHITKKNVLDLISASNRLGFTEAVAPDNLYARCQRFIEKEITDNGVQAALSIIEHSTSNDATDSSILINILAEHALAFQNSDEDYTREIVELLSELTKLQPSFVDATIQEFERLGVNFIDFFFCAETPNDLDVLLSCDEDTCRNERSIFSYVSEALDKGISAGEVDIETVDPKKLVCLWNPGVLRRPMLSEDAIKAYVSSNMCILKAEHISNLHPQLVKDLVSTALSTSRSRAGMDEVEHLAGLVDQFLILEAQRNPWDGSTDSKENFKEIAECVPLIDRESHDLLYDAVASFSESFTQDEADDIWKMVDPYKLAEAKFEDAINCTLLHCDNYWARLLRRRQDNHLPLKRKLSVLEANQSKRKSRRTPDYCGTLFPVFVRSLDGKTLSCLVVEAHTTIDDIKTAISKRESIHCKRIWWPVYRGKKLLESRTIASYGVEKDCTLYMKILRDIPDVACSKIFSYGFLACTNCVCGCK